MIVKPKDYGPKSLAGYLLNDVEYKEDLFIEKKLIRFLRYCVILIICIM